MSNSALLPKALGTHSLYRDAPTSEYTFKITTGNSSPKFIESKEVKQKEKAKELITIERVREKPWKNNEREINNLPDKEFKTLVIRMLIGLGKIIYEYSENFDNELENIF